MYNPFLQVINQLLPEPQASLLNGILFGIRAQMPYALYQALVTTGLLHVIALSGTNISILIDLVAKVTLFLGRKISIIVTVCIIVAFVMMVGVSPTVVRAAIMGAITLIAVYLGRKSWSILSLFLASGVMLLIRPQWIGDISFQLSFLATLGIILGNDLVKRKYARTIWEKIIYALKVNLALTLSAQLFTLPIIILNFGRLSLISPVSNLLVGWAIQPIMILGLATGILGWIWMPLGILPSWLAWVPLSYFLSIVEMLAKVPGAAIRL